MMELTTTQGVQVRRVLIDRVLDELRAVDAQTLALRAALTELWLDQTPFHEQKFVCDELAVVTAQSSITTQRWLTQAYALREHPAVHELVQNGIWSVAHADAFLDELLCVAREHRAEVLALVLAGAARTPHQLRKATRAAAFVVDPKAALERAAKARTGRRVSVHDENDGSGSLVATGPKGAVAAMLAGLDALCLPASAGDDRTLSQRRFDTLLALITGQLAPVGAHVQVLVHLSTLVGQDDQAAEIPGLGLITAPEARDLAADAHHLRRTVIDDHGQLVSVDGAVERPTPAATPAAPATADVTLLSDEVEPEPASDECSQDDDLFGMPTWDEPAVEELDLAQQRTAYARDTNPYPNEPGTDPAFDTGLAFLAEILATVVADGRPVAACSIRIDEHARVRLHWPDPPDPSGGLTPPGGDGPSPNGASTQPMPAGYVDDQQAMGVRDAVLDLPTDPVEQTRELRRRYLRRQLPSWHGRTHRLTFHDPELVHEPARVTSGDRAWWDEHDDALALAHQQIAEKVSVARRLSPPDGGWPQPTHPPARAGSRATCPAR